MHFRELIKHKLDVEGVPLRVLARAMNLPYASVHNYAYMSVQPHKASLDKLADYFNEPVSRLLEEDDQDFAEKYETLRHTTLEGKTGQESRLLEAFRQADRIGRITILRVAELAAGGPRK